jgi:prepilin-type N-terminal cleavage/methylation domain-containing protein/prepilin-type processing-associated H-X9-DG protein
MRHRANARFHRGFTLVELLVVIGIIAVLISILIPALSRANAAGLKAKCLANVRNMQTAHWMYANDNKGYMIQAGLAHGGGMAVHDRSVAWIDTLQRYYQAPLLRRCPADASPYWDRPVPGLSPDTLRLTSYGINDYLDRALIPDGDPYYKITQVPRASAVIQFCELAEDTDYSASDHVHVELFFAVGLPDSPPQRMARQLQTHRHGGSAKSWDAVCNYGFLDGHAESLTVREVYQSPTMNRFDPRFAQ